MAGRVAGYRKDGRRFLVLFLCESFMSPEACPEMHLSRLGCLICLKMSPVSASLIRYRCLLLFLIKSCSSECIIKLEYYNYSICLLAPLYFSPFIFQVSTVIYKVRRVLLWIKVVIYLSPEILPHGLFNPLGTFIVLLFDRYSLSRAYF